jgi:hypothetical protein
MQVIDPDPCINLFSLTARLAKDSRGASRHLGGSATGKSQQQDALGICSTEDETSDAVSKRLSLARTSARDDQEWPGKSAIVDAVVDRRSLAFVQVHKFTWPSGLASARADKRLRANGDGIKFRQGLHPNEYVQENTFIQAWIYWLQVGASQVPPRLFPSFFVPSWQAAPIRSHHEEGDEDDD